MPNLDWTTRPRRMFYVRRRVLNDEIYLIHLTQIYKINPGSDRLWRLCDGSKTVLEIISCLNVPGDAPAGNVEWACNVLLFFQKAGLIMPLYAESRMPLQAERNDWEFSPELVDIVRASCPPTGAEADRLAAARLQPFADRVFRLCYESYFAAHGHWYGLSEEAFRNYWIELAQLDFERAVSEWTNHFKVKSLLFDPDRGFCRACYADVVYEGFVGHRH